MKRFLPIICGLSAAILSSCSDNEASYTQNYNASTINLITNLESGESYANRGDYTVTLNITNSGQTGEITVNNLVINNMSTNFVTEEQPYTTDFANAYFTDLKSSTTDLSDSFFLLTPYYYYPSQFQIENNYRPSQDILVAEYTINDMWRVNTFLPTTFNVGTTETSYQGADGLQTFSTETIYYELMLNMEDNTATIIMFNAKFSDSEREPIKAQINAEGLDVSYDNGVINVKGENIVPLIPEGGEMTPNESFIFNSIEFNTTSRDLTQCEINFVVAGRYQGNFRGSYVSDKLLK